jgi:protein-disulfide isomerase
MHDRLFENQDALAPEDLLAHAAALNLDLVRFSRDLDARAHLPRIQEDIESGISSGVEGTPSFFINGVKYGGRYDVVSLTHALQRARKAA